MILNIALAVMSSVLPAGAVFLCFYVIHGDIAIEPNQARLYTVVLVFWITIIMLWNMISLLTLQDKSFKLSAYVLVITSCIGVPFAFATIYSLFQRTGGCIEGYATVYDGIHFSYTTFTTLGYGDLSPVGVCRAFTALESILGYLTLGLVIAVLFLIYQEKDKIAAKQNYQELEAKMSEVVENALAENKSKSRREDSSS